MAIENIEEEASAILGMMAGSTHPRSGRMVLAEKEMLRLLNFVRLAAHQIGKAVALEVEMDIVARERDSYRASFNNERIRASKWEHVQELNVKIKQAMHERFRRAERERDEYKHRCKVSDGVCAIAEQQRDHWMQRAKAAEAEIARRDAAASKPVAWISERNLKILGKAFSVVVKHEPVMVRPVALYTDAPPAVLPPVANERDAFNNWNNDDNLPIAGVSAKNAAWLAWQARAALGAQPQKPVVLPEPHAHLIWIQAGRGPDDYWDDVEVSRSEKDRCCDGSERYAVYSEFEIKAMLDAAAVPYEVKK